MSETRAICPNSRCRERDLTERQEECPSCGTRVHLRGTYLLKKRLGKGGMGTTYLAWDSRFAGTGQELCVVKEVGGHLEVNEKTIHLFRREAARLLALRHDSVPGFRDFFVEEFPSGNQGCFIVQEFIRGRSMGDRLKETDAPLPIYEAVQMMRKVLNVLGYLHGVTNPETGEAAPVAHLDIKPDNIMERQGDGRVFLIDFGIASQLRGSVLASEGATVSLLGFTPGYAPPEQMRGRAAPASDFYSLAVTFLVLITGRKPADLFDPGTETPAFRGMVELPDSLSDLLEGMMAVSPRERPSSAAEIAEALDGIEERGELDEHRLLSAVPLPTSETDESLAQTAAFPVGERGVRQESLGARGELSSKAPSLEKKKSRARWLPVAIVGLMLAAGLASWGIRDLWLAGEVGSKDTIPGSRSAASDGEGDDRREDARTEEVADDAGASTTVARHASSATTEAAAVEAADSPSEGQATERSVIADGGSPAADDPPESKSRAAGTRPGMVLIAGGCFSMGGGRSGNSRPARKICLTPFYLDLHEVTAGDFLLFLRSKARINRRNYRTYRRRGWRKLCNVGHRGRRSHPANCVSWTAADAFCRWKGKRLPTEAQWEYAARGEKGLTYPWGGAVPTCDYAVFKGRRGRCRNMGTSPVGSKPRDRSPFGVMDLAGNVWEWVADCYYWKVLRRWKDGARDPAWKPEKKRCRKSIRGGTWSKGARRLRSTTRRGEKQWKLSISGGFRCAARPAAQTPR